MRRLAAAAVFIATIGALAALPSYAKPPAPAPLSVSITSGPSNPTTSTNASFGFTIGGAPTSTECRESAGVGDRFNRSGALGSADAGGSWSAPSEFSTYGQRARVLAAAASTRLAVLGASLADADVSARVSLAAVPTGNPAGALVAARIAGSDYFGSRLIVQPGGQVRVQLVRSLAGLENVLASAGVGSKYKVGQVFWLRLQALGSTIQAKAWTNGKVEPASWQLSIVDPTPLVGASIGFGAYGASGLSNQVEIVTDDFSAIDPNAAGSVAPCPGGSAAYNGLALGGHVFRVRASAASEQVTAIYPWTINPPAPTVTLNSTPVDRTTDTSASFAWTTTGIVDSTTCTLDGAAGSCSSPVTYNDLAPGQHSFTVTVANVGGSSTASYSWTINPPAPTVSLTSTPDSVTTATSATFVWTTTGVLDSTTCTVNGAAGSCSSPVTYTSLAPGEHSFSVEVTNAGGSGLASYSWTILPPAPTVSIRKGPESGTPETTATFEWTTTGEVDATNCELDVDDPAPGAFGRQGTLTQAAGISPCSSPVTYTDLAPGPHTFKVTVLNAGGSADVGYIWMITEPTPTVTITSRPSDGTFSTSGTFTYTISDPNATTSCELDGSQANITSCDSAGATVSGLQPGPHTFTVSAQNDFGTGSASHSWTIGAPDADMIPIAIPATPVSTAAVFYDEATGSILSVNHFCENASLFGVPPGLTGWTTFAPGDPSGLCSSEASMSVAPTTGVAIATSSRPACTTAITTRCLEDEGFTTVNDLCRQEDGQHVKCYFAGGSGASQSVHHGLQFVRGYATGTVGGGPPALRSAWLDPASCPSAYFNSTPGQCAALFHAYIDLGSFVTFPVGETRIPANTEVRYRIVYGSASGAVGGASCSFSLSCDLQPTGPYWSTTGQLPQFIQHTAGNALAVRVRLRNTIVDGTVCGSNFSAACQWFFTGNAVTTSQPTDAQIYEAPVQRSFMGDESLSGTIKFLRLAADPTCVGFPVVIEGESASQTIGEPHCFAMDMGTASQAAAQGQDEPPIAFSPLPGQGAFLDCDPSPANLADEIAIGCGTAYAPSGFDTSPLCPSVSGFFDLPKAPPFDSWPPFTCALVLATASSAQVVAGMNSRMFGVTSNPTCPPDGSGFILGRNYWSDANNFDDTWAFPNLNPEDPRIVRLPVLAENGFTGSGNVTYPIAAIRRFYITGWGTGGSGGTMLVRDPCPGNAPPASIFPDAGTPYVWGHFLP